MAACVRALSMAHVIKFWLFFMLFFYLRIKKNAGLLHPDSDLFDTFVSREQYNLRITFTDKDLR